MSERVHEKSADKPKLHIDVSGGVATESPTVRVPAGRYVQPAFSRSGEAWVRDNSSGTDVEYDAENTPSPLTGVAQNPVGITAPAGAKNLYLMAAAAIRFGDNGALDGTAGNGYDYLPAYVGSLPLPVSAGVTTWVRINADTGNTTVYFRFDV